MSPAVQDECDIVNELLNILVLFREVDWLDGRKHPGGFSLFQEAEISFQGTTDKLKAPGVGVSVEQG
jgi:hypothetical protein